MNLADIPILEEVKRSRDFDVVLTRHLGMVCNATAARNRVVSHEHVKKNLRLVLNSIVAEQIISNSSGPTRQG